MKLQVLLLTFILILAPLVVRAEDHTENKTEEPNPCRSVLSYYNKALLLEKLEQFPVLSKMIVDMMDDPYVPGSIKRVIKIGVEDPETTILNLTDQIRKKYKIRSNTGAVRLGSFEGMKYYLWSRDDFEPTANQIAAQEISPKAMVGNSTIYAPERAITSRENDLINLIHELAHVRFSTFFDRYLPIIALKFSKSLIELDEDGKYAVNQQLYDFLTERYAMQVEWAVLNSTYGYYYDEFPEVYENWWGVEYPAIVRGVVMVVNYRYKITDPEVRALESRSLSDVLLNGNNNR